MEKEKDKFSSIELMKEYQLLTKIIELDEAIIGMRNDGIVHVFFKAHTEIDIALQEKLIDAYNKITDKQKYPFIFEADDYCTITKEARDNAIHIEHRSPVDATAVIVQNTAYRLIANFYLKFNKPKRIYKVFKNFNEGIEWLKTSNNRIN